MSLEKLRVANLTKTSDIRKCGEWDDINNTIIELQFLQRLGNHLDPREIPIPSTLDLKLSQCVLHYADADSSIRQPALALTPKESALGSPIQPKPNVQLLNRNPVAKVRVCGWESDYWFKNGHDFIKFWNRSHPDSLECIDLDSDEKLVAVLYTSLQAIKSLFQDLIKILEIAEQDSKESRAITFQIYRKALLSQSIYYAAAESLVFLCNHKETGVFKIFCKTLSESLKRAWRTSQILKERVNVDEYERVLRNAAFYLDLFNNSLEKCEVAARTWLANNLSTDLIIDKDVLDAVTNSVLAMENLNRSLSISVSEPYGVLDHKMKNIQKSFQGMSIDSGVLLTAEEAVADASAQN